MTSQLFFIILELCPELIILWFHLDPLEGSSSWGKKHQQLLLLMDKRDILIETENS